MIYEVHATFFIAADDFDKALALHDDAMAAAQFSVPACVFSTSTVTSVDPMNDPVNQPDEEN